MLSQVVARNVSVRTAPWGGLLLPLPLVVEPTSRMFGGVSEQLRREMARSNVTMHNHGAGVAPQQFAAGGNARLHAAFDVTSIAVGRTGRRFANVIEGREGLQIYGTIWHPEMPSFEHEMPMIPHSPAAVHTSQWAADFFVQQCRTANNRSFGGKGNASVVAAAEAKVVIAKDAGKLTDCRGGGSQITECYYWARQKTDDDGDSSPPVGGRPPPCALKGGCPDDVHALCQPAEAKPQWPTFHLMDNVTRLKDGRLSVEGLNDINAVFSHRGLYHIMNQAGGGDWTNAVSNDLVRSHHELHAVPPSPQRCCSSAFDNTTCVIDRFTGTTFPMHWMHPPRGPWRERNGAALATARSVSPTWAETRTMAALLSFCTAPTVAVHVDEAASSTARLRRAM